MLRSLLACVLLASASRCTSAAHEPVSRDASRDASNGVSDAGVSDADVSDARARSQPDAATREPCRAPAGTTSMPNQISDVLAVLNALPKPVSLPCFIETLARPLAVHATTSLFSAQPSVGPDSPRIFMFSNELTLSIVPDGPGRQLLELGEHTTPTRTRKAELEFPITSTIAPELPFERILYDGGGTSCGLCHAQEQQDDTINDVPMFSSVALRPLGTHIGIAELSEQWKDCDPHQPDASTAPERCALLDALFTPGELVEHAFPADYATFQ